MKIYFFKFIFYSVFFLLANPLWAEVGAPAASTSASTVGEVKSPPLRSRMDDLQKESSSFVADPDPLDPLPVKKESLKEDDEPVLEDIKSILNAPSKKKTAVAVPPKTTFSKIKTPKKQTLSKASKPKVAGLKPKKLKSTKKINKTLSPDEADFSYEKKLNQNYLRYNIEPTSSEVWSKVTADRKAEVFTVEKGNTLESISKTLFGDSQFWPKIWALNHSRISNPHQIYPGLKIYFYPSVDGELPTLSLENLTEANILTTGTSLDGRSYSPQMTEFEKFNLRNQDNKKNKINGPQPLPDSIPIVRRKEYFLKLKAGSAIIDMREIPPAELVVPQNPYILSSEKLSADFVVPEDEINNLICSENQFIKKIIQKNPIAQAGRYLLVEPLSVESSRLKKTFIYKLIGDVHINEKNQLRVTSCHQLMNSDTLIVSEFKVQNLPEPTETLSQSPQLVESLEAEGLDFFNFGQRVIINTGSLEAPPGQRLDIYSESAGGVVGKLQIMKNSGTFSIGFLTGISRLIQIGDQITLTDKNEKKQ